MRASIGPKIKCHKEPDGTWTATLYISGVFHAQMKGFTTPSEARAVMREKYL